MESTSFSFDLSEVLNAAAVFQPMLKEGLDAEEVEILCTCHICHEIIEEPKSLHCKHSYCKDCIEELVEFEDDDPTIRCPECRSKTVVEKGETVSSLKRELTLEKLLVRLDELALTNDKTSKISEDGLLTCCSNPKSWYCWGCKYYFCNLCIDHPGTETTKCKSMLPLFVKYSRRFQSYVPYCLSHNAFHTRACMRCADTFCRYCGNAQHKGHDDELTTFTQYTKCFKKPIDSKIERLHSFITKQKDTLEQTKIKNYNIQHEKDRIDRFLQQKKIILLSHVLLMLDIIESPILKYCEESSINFEDVKKDIEITVDNDLFHAILDAYDDVRIASLNNNKSITRSASMLSEKVNLNPLLFPNLISYSEAEKYVYEALEKANQYTKNKMVCELPGSSVLDDDIERVGKFEHEKMMIVLSTLFALELCEKKIIKKFYNAWKEFKISVTQFKEKINESILIANDLLGQFQKLSQGNAIDLISRSKDLLVQYHNAIHTKIEKAIRNPEFDVRIEEERAPLNRIHELMDCKHNSAILESFCAALNLDFASVLELIPQNVCNEIERDKLIYLFGNREDCDGAEKYVHLRLKDIGLHNSKSPDVDICKKDVLSLVEKGFPLNASINAVYFTDNKGAETAMEWIFQHSKDEEFDQAVILHCPVHKDSNTSPSDDDDVQLKSLFAGIYFRSYSFCVHDAKIALNQMSLSESALINKKGILHHFDETDDGCATTDDDLLQKASTSSKKRDLNNNNNNNNGDTDVSSCSVESGISSRKKSYRKRKENWSRKGHECANGIVTLYYLSEKMIANKTVEENFKAD